MPTGTRPKNIAAARTLSILSVFKDPPFEFGVTQISQMLGLDKSVVHRILDTLVAYEFLVRDGKTHRYKVGLRAWEVGRHGETDLMSLVSTASSSLQKMVNEVGGTGYVGRKQDGHLIYLSTLNGAGPLQVHVEVGTTIPLHTTAMGKAVLAMLNQNDAVFHELRDEILAPNTYQALMTELGQIRKEGFATNRNSAANGVGAVGVGFRTVTGTIEMAMSIAFPLLDTHLHLFELLPPRLDQLRRELVSQGLIEA